MRKSEIQVIAFIGVILIAVGFIFGYAIGGKNVKPEIIEKEVIKTQYVTVESDTPTTTPAPADT